MASKIYLYFLDAEGGAVSQGTPPQWAVSAAG